MVNQTTLLDCPRNFKALFISSEETKWSICSSTYMEWINTDFQVHANKFIIWHDGDKLYMWIMYKSHEMSSWCNEKSGPNILQIGGDAKDTFHLRCYLASSHPCLILPSHYHIHNWLIFQSIYLAMRAGNVAVAFFWQFQGRLGRDKTEEVTSFMGRNMNEFEITGL